MNNLLGKGRKDSSYEAYTKYLEVKLTRYIQSSAFAALITHYWCIFGSVERDLLLQWHGHIIPLHYTGHDVCPLLPRLPPHLTPRHPAPGHSSGGFKLRVDYNTKYWPLIHVSLSFSVPYFDYGVFGVMVYIYIQRLTLLILIGLYFYYFGHASFIRYKEENIATINKVLPTSSEEVNQRWPTSEQEKSIINTVKKSLWLAIMFFLTPVDFKQVKVVVISIYFLIRAMVWHVTYKVRLAQSV